MLYLIFELLDVSHLITAAFNFISSFITTFPGVVDIGIKGQRGGLRNYTGLVREMFEDLHFYRVHLAHQSISTKSIIQNKFAYEFFSENVENVPFLEMQIILCSCTHQNVI